MSEGHNPRVFNPDGSMLKRDEAPPSRFTVLSKKIMDGVDRFNKKFDDGLDRIFGGKRSSGQPAGPFVRAPRVAEELKAEIAGETHPGTDDLFVDVPDKQYDWKDDSDVSSTPVVTPVTELANAATWQERIEAKRLQSARKPTDRPPEPPTPPTKPAA